MALMMRQYGIALLATGDEIVSGDCLNTNVTELARWLEANKYCVSTHLAIRDDQKALCGAISWLLSHHRVLITVGGLGPTEDDVTLRSLSQVCQRKLVFAEDMWHRIQHYFKKRGLKCPVSTKNQAYRLEGSVPFVNHLGTADGCMLNYHDQMIITLPGPPRECLPMFEDHVSLALEPLSIQKAPKRHMWLLLGIGESSVVDLINPLLHDLKLSAAYRASFPYLEVKLFTHNDQETFSSVTQNYCLGW